MAETGFEAARRGRKKLVLINVGLCAFFLQWRRRKNGCLSMYTYGFVIAFCGRGEGGSGGGAYFNCPW